MTHDIKVHLADLMRAALDSVAPDQVETAIVLERPKQASHGDFACNLAMQLARAMKRNPRELAQLLLSEIPSSPFVAKIEIAGAGFINFHLHRSAKLEVVRNVLEQGADFGRSSVGGKRKVQIEFVSANPTGPLHVGHGRGAAYGASLCSLMAFAGWDVTREYYVNDAGRQMDILATSAWLRYLELHDHRVAFPPNGYQGDYVRSMAMEMKIAHGDKYVRTAAEVLEGTPGLPPPDRADDDAKLQRETHLDALIANAKRLLGEDWNYVHNHVLTEQLEDCRSDLEDFGVHFDVWFSEKSLFDTGLVERCVERLNAAGHLYEQNGALWFKSTEFGDEKDRVVQRDNGLYTYFASDIAYHLNKFERGFDRVINIWGADHHGYIPRVKGALKALELDPDLLDIALVQFAVLYRNGQKCYEGQGQMDCETWGVGGAAAYNASRFAARNNLRDFDAEWTVGRDTVRAHSPETRPLKEAIVTLGGVPLNEVDPATLQSRVCPGLYFAGEVMDIDGPTGGYNLTAAFATAALAVRSLSGQRSNLYG